MATEMLGGVFTALVTPFRPSPDRPDAIDWTALEALLEEQIAAGISGLVPCGTTGEATSLSGEEHAQVVRFVVERVGGRVPVVAGTGSNSTRRAVELTDAAREAGADAVLSVTPVLQPPATRRTRRALPCDRRRRTPRRALQYPFAHRARSDDR